MAVLGFRLLNKLGPLVAVFANNSFGPSGTLSGPIMPSFVKKFPKLRQLLDVQLEPRLPLVEATQKKGRPSLRSGLNYIPLESLGSLGVSGQAAV